MLLLLYSRLLVIVLHSLKYVPILPWIWLWRQMLICMMTLCKSMKSSHTPYPSTTLTPSTPFTPSLSHRCPIVLSGPMSLLPTPHNRGAQNILLRAVRTSREPHALSGLRSGKVLVMSNRTYRISRWGT